MIYSVSVPLRGGDVYRTAIECTTADTAAVRILNQARTAGHLIEDGVVVVYGPAGQKELELPVSRDLLTGNHVEHMVNRCPQCQSAKTAITHVHNNRPRPGHRLRYVECHSCRHTWTTEQAPERRTG